VNQEQLMRIIPHAPFSVFIPLSNAMADYQINTLNRMAMFLPNIAHESMEFRYTEEIATGEAYENRVDLGNNLPEAKAWAPDGRAGPWFKGRGFMQTTGYLNYKKASQALFGDETVLLKNPRMLCQVVPACRSAALFFSSSGCMEAADKGDFLLCCQIVNMPERLRGSAVTPNGWTQRLNYYNRAMETLKEIQRV
jgi:putative chitinase